MTANIARSADERINGRCACATNLSAKVLISAPPTIVPTMVESTVADSSHALAFTSFSAGSSSVRMPYLAGEYAAAPKPTTP